MSTEQTSATPRQTLSVTDACAMIVGLIVGAGIFGTPSIVAGAVGDSSTLYAVWIAGGVFSIIGALCYAELATAFPSAGGEYHFLQRAFGRSLAFLYGWARMTVIVAGSIAVFAYLFGDYLSRVINLGTYSSAIWAAIVVVVLTAVNYRGIREGKATQNLFTVLEIGGLLLIIVAGLFFAAPPAAAVPAVAGADQPWYMGAGIGSAMIFVLFTYGGWNDAAYISAEVRDRERNMARALLIAISVVALLYVLVNFAYLKGLGYDQMARSNAVAADLLKAVWGPTGEKVIAIMIAIAALTSVNGSMIVGARSNYALGRDWPMLGFLGKWDEASGSPRNAMLVQGVVVIGAGGAGRDPECRLQGAGRIFAAGVLGLFPADGHCAVRAAGQGAGCAAAVQGAVLSGGAGDFCADVWVPAVFQPDLSPCPCAGGAGCACCRRSGADSGETKKAIKSTAYDLTAGRRDRVPGIFVRA